MINGRFATVIHILTLLGREEEEVASSYIAGSININPVLVRKEISILRDAGFVATQEGKNGGSRLVVQPSKIRLSDLYKIVYQDGLFAHSKNLPNQHCAVGRRISSIMDELNGEAEQALLKRLHAITIQDLLNKV